jgi:hypothetical protein
LVAYIFPPTGEKGEGEGRSLYLSSGFICRPEHHALVHTFSS